MKRRDRKRHLATIHREEQAHGVSGMEWSEHQPEQNETKWRRARWAVYISSKIQVMS
ncbi:MAG TPA: hypothetical protein PKJ91_04310 [Methanoregulaceae archaeon]|nr:hypothetical protein [Methanoregulaceae archaeon]